MAYTPAQIAQASGDDLAAITNYLPHVLNGLTHFGMNTHLVRVGCFATIAVECDWIYLTELGSGNEYDYRSDLGNTQPGDGARYKGRGFVQLTGRANYGTYGNALGLDLVNHPEQAAEPHVAGLTLALYFQQRGIPAMCEALNWEAVRRAVNGGINGWDRYIGVVNALLAIPEVAGPLPVPVTRAGVATILRQTPASNGKHAIGPDHKDVLLTVGQQVTFVPDPSPGPYHGQTTTKLFAHVLVGKGPVHGWLPRENLGTSSS